LGKRDIDYEAGVFKTIKITSELDEHDDTKDRFETEMIYTVEDVQKILTEEYTPKSPGELEEILVQEAKEERRTERSRTAGYVVACLAAGVAGALVNFLYHESTENSKPGKADAAITQKYERERDANFELRTENAGLKRKIDKSKEALRDLRKDYGGEKISHGQCVKELNTCQYQLGQTRAALNDQPLSIGLELNRELEKVTSTDDGYTGNVETVIEKYLGPNGKVIVEAKTSDEALRQLYKTITGPDADPSAEAIFVNHMGHLIGNINPKSLYVKFENN
jgi:hypothetical protein